MASTSAASAWRLVLLIGGPLAFAVTGTLHLSPRTNPRRVAILTTSCRIGSFGQVFMSSSW
jgi:hypothetical protein